MSWALTAAGAMAAGSIYSSYEGNKTAARNSRQAAAQSSEEAMANYQSLVRNYQITAGNIQNQINEVNNAIGMELSQAKLDGLKAEATTTAALSDRGFIGATAARLNQSTAMKVELLSDQIAQKADSNYKDLMSKFDEARYNFENGIFSNEIQSKRNATQIDIARQSATTSIGGMAAGAVSAGASGYVLGKQLGSMGSSFAEVRAASTPGTSGEITSYAFKN